MIQQIEVFLFIISILFIIKHVFTLVVKYTTNDLEPIRINWINELLLFVSLSYIITYLIK